ncbi:MAG: hypothetical protein NT023_22430 [Armatimonadetes bacterium]|nr:hypothetical protein [Armatimonadota bacterium]
MSTSSTYIWLEQAKSDMRTALLLWETAKRDASTDIEKGGQGHSNLYCQVMAKCQQVVEKGIKAIAIALTDNPSVKKVTLTVGYSHSIDQFITPIIQADSEDGDDIDYIQKALSSNRDKIGDIMVLVPHKPPKGVTSRPKNTEYPYHDVANANVEIAPASQSAFLFEEVKSSLDLAKTILDRARASATLLNRTPLP